ncbi:ImmA/IrrE family metallo-endopeptidase [Sphaerisporangium album]|uniref:ImmA/IrrE family metallo-endopeptidase n=1 Tax=Sphaerisporangium album TaxID=509200 RepID=A0A367FIT0_9ACTN|nr:XRE family transcriptional regulator [Sphaerisporangium album]RCG30214.1 ImmA/IrrE family metallo-endopeptidase [Sphaerisporangium album]
MSERSDGGGRNPGQAGGQVTGQNPGRPGARRGGRDRGQVRLFDPTAPGRGGPTPQAVADAFDQARLTQARRLAGLTKKDLAERIGVTPAAVGQYETGATHPRPDLVPRLAETLGVPMAFFLPGRPHAKLDGSMAHFRSLRSTRVHQRVKAVAFVEQVWELTHALERRVRLPHVDLPGFSGGEVHSGVELPRDPAAAARELRRHWGLGTGPISHLVRHMEAHGIVVVLPPPDEDATTVDAFSTSQLPRPIVVLTANRFDDIHRYRFTAAHELGHLVLHGETAAGDVQQEREADTFAAEFLTPRDSILPDLPRRLDLRRLAELKHVWGVSVDSLLYRCREVGLLSDSAAGRAYQRLAALRDQPGFANEPITGYPGEHPVLLSHAFDLAASETALTLPALAAQLAWTLPRVRQLLGLPDHRPELRIVP